METLLNEHAEALIYGIIGIIMVIIICSVCVDKWNKITPQYKTDISKNSSKFIKESTGKYPIIEADEIIYTEYKNEKFNCRDFISAKDYDGKDISERINIYGKVDTFKRGVYKIRCVVTSERQLACTKYINVIVE